MRLKYFLFCCLCGGFFHANAQLHYGFKTGLNFARMTGPSEADAAGNSLETWKNITGFHIGMSLSYEITDNLALRGEFLYSKRGAKYTFEGPSYRTFLYDGGSTRSTGKAKYAMNINNSYLDIPVMVVGRWKHWELSAGAYAGLLVQSNGEGAYTYTEGRTAPPNNSAIDKVAFNLSYNYRRDDPGEYTGDLTNSIRLDNATRLFPQTIGAYYDFTEDKGALYNTLDYGVVGGLSYYISRSLYIGGRLQYGLADLTNNDADVMRTSTDDDGSLLFRNDKDQNWTIQASVGFKF